jgi:hypothetical protein
VPIPFSCLSIFILQVIGVTPPLHQSVDNLMSFDIRNTRWIVCADSFEEVMLAAFHYVIIYVTIAE